MSYGSNSPILNRKLPYSDGNSCPPVYSLNLRFGDDPDLNVRYYIYIIYLCSITIVHKRVLNYHTYRWKEQNNYVGEE